MNTPARDPSELTEEEVRKRYADLLDFVANAAVGLHWVGPDGTILWANQAEMDLLGYRADEYIGRPIWEFHADRPVIDDMLRRLKAGETLHSYEARLRCKDGSIRTVLISSNVSRQNGKFSHTRCFTRDITERKLAQRELFETRRLLERVADIIPEVLYVYDLRTRANTYINREMTSVLGYRPDEVLQMGNRVMERLVHPDDLARIGKDYERIAGLPDNVVDEAVYRIRHADGKYRWMSNRCVVFDRAADGKATQVLGVGTDVTAGKLIQEALARSQAQLQAMIDEAPMGIYVVDQDLILQHVNPLARPAFGNINPLIGRNLREIIPIIWPARVAEQVLEKFVHTLSTGEAYIAGEFAEERADLKTREYYDWQLHQMRLADGRTGVVCYFKDISSHVLAREAALRQAEQLWRSNRELEQFAYVSSHDLQEPLRKVSVLVDLLRSRYRGKMDGDADKTIDSILAAADRMRELINSLLTYSRLGKDDGPPGQVDTRGVVEAAVGDLEVKSREAGATISIRGDWPSIAGREYELHQLFQNLISNAIKFRRDVPPLVTITGIREPNAFKVQVSDNGIGFEKVYADRIFQVFQRLQPQHRYPGTGIGLAICKKIVERNGGKISVDSRPGEGSTFTVSFPNTAAPPP